MHSAGNPTLCRQITSTSQILDVKWATQNCSLSFQTIGVWPEYADGTDINAVCRNSEASLLASGDDFGKVKLFLYPATQPKVSQYIRFGSGFDLLIFFFCVSMLCKRRTN